MIKIMHNSIVYTVQRARTLQQHLFWRPSLTLHEYLCSFSIRLQMSV